MKEKKAKKEEINVKPAADENAGKNVPWQPTYKWLAKTAGIILAALVVIFFALNIVLKPYMRTIPADITPWLYKNAQDK